MRPRDDRVIRIAQQPTQQRLGQRRRGCQWLPYPVAEPVGRFLDLTVIGLCRFIAYDHSRSNHCDDPECLRPEARRERALSVPSFRRPLCQSSAAQPTDISAAESALPIWVGRYDLVNRCDNDKEAHNRAPLCQIRLIFLGEIKSDRNPAAPVSRALLCTPIADRAAIHMNKIRT